MYCQVLIAILTAIASEQWTILDMDMVSKLYFSKYICIVYMLLIWSLCPHMYVFFNEIKTYDLNFVYVCPFLTYTFPF